MKQMIKRIPFIGLIILYLYRKWINLIKPFSSSENYWVNRYNSGGNSGYGSCGQLAKFKAQIINDFVLQNKITSVIEFGCGDGSQLKLAEYPLYMGFDISSVALSICEQVFVNDLSKSFNLMKNYNNETAQLAVSLDVIFHLVEDAVFAEYMGTLFSAAEQFVIIYSSDSDENLKDQAIHVKHRIFSKWIEKILPEWNLLEYIRNEYPLRNSGTTGSFSDFFIYERS